MSYANVGKVWSDDSFKEYLKTVKKPSWARAVTIHHTAAPSLAQRPNGFLIQHIHNIMNYYRGTLKWNRGPHLFTDEDEIFGMTPLTVQGIHAVSFNSYSIGVEVLGNYDIEDPFSGRGLKCWELAARCTSDLLDWIGVAPSSTSVLFHRDDKRTSKSCPGRRITKPWFLDLVNKSKAGSTTTSTTTTLSPHGEGSVDIFEPVVDFMMRERKVNFAAASQPLRREGKLYFYNDHWLERAYYDAAKKLTIAPVSELKEALDTFK